MNWLLHNPIADLYGPYFLILYGLFVIVLLVAARFWITSRDTTGELSPVQIPADPDPYEIAWLRGGVNEVIRVVVFNLLQRGFLERRKKKSAIGLVKENKIAMAEPAPTRGKLTSLENRVLKHFFMARDAASIFKSTFTQKVESACANFEARLERARLLQSREQKSAAISARFAVGTLIVGLAGYKFCMALWKGHTNVGFLVIMAIASLVGLAFITRSRRVSQRGSRYLSELQRAFARLKTQAGTDSSKSKQPSPGLVLVCALFGVSSLASTPHSYYPDQLHGGTSLR
jgi:uncharacterized protein (TIGR04222 family)